MRCHDLRDTFASHLVIAGIDIRTVQESLGHATLAMTVRYAHLSTIAVGRSRHLIPPCQNSRQLPVRPAAYYGVRLLSKDSMGFDYKLIEVPLCGDDRGGK